MNASMLSMNALFCSISPVTDDLCHFTDQNTAFTDCFQYADIGS
jgi:hypothetical protein